VDGCGLRLLALFIIIWSPARGLCPTVNRGWACGAVAADECGLIRLTLIDSPRVAQWDVLDSAGVSGRGAAGVGELVDGGGNSSELGCMAKGQLLLAGPLLMLWPLFEGRFGALARILCGFLIGAEAGDLAVESSPPPQELGWIATAMVAAGADPGGVDDARRAERKRAQWVLTPLFGRRGGPMRGAGANRCRRFCCWPSLAISALAIATALIFHGLARQGNRRFRAERWDGFAAGALAAVVPSPASTWFLAGRRFRGNGVDRIPFIWRELFLGWTLGIRIRIGGRHDQMQDEHPEFLQPHGRS